MTVGGDTIPGALGLPMRRFGHGAGHGFFRFHWFGFHSWHGGLATVLILIVILAAVVVGVRAIRRR